MKKSLLITVGLLIALFSYSQYKKSAVKLPKGWNYCPRGTLKTLQDEIRTVREVQICISPFLISNEITNKEFRTFYDHIKETPDDTLYWIDLKEVASYKDSSMRKGATTFIKMAIHKDILSILIDQSVWEKDSSSKNYFFNPYYNDYPVVGVTFEGARFYCIWKTSNENDMLYEKGKPLIQDYRIPEDCEWEYAASFNEEFSDKHKKDLHEVKKGVPNKLNIKNLENNVSEWTESPVLKDDTTGLVRGGSYKTANSTELKEPVKKNKSKDYIGFRIVRSVDTE